ncbi:MAG: class I SAM-dependent methyltransferase [Candidatus Rokubacteria bacterium]|nr:class I SAM-dependent methyltransferase [Candidatus Rokubacteria bacterium]
MLIELGYLHNPKAPPSDAAVAAVLRAVERCRAEGRPVAELRLSFDWCQYRQTFREPVVDRRSVAASEAPAVQELAVDLRQADAETLGALAEATLRRLAGEPVPPPDRLYLEELGPLRASIIWRFNTLYWREIDHWERTFQRGFEAALPGGRSDASNPAQVEEAVEQFFESLRVLEKRGTLPPELFVLEIGAGTGERAGLWLDRFRDLAESHGKDYYGRVRFLLSDYSMPMLDRAHGNVLHHLDKVSFITLDALDPLKTLAFLRYKVLFVHLSNVYDNLPTDEVAMREGRLYLVEGRAYVAREAARAVATSHGVEPDGLGRQIELLLRIGPDAFPDSQVGVRFWREVWRLVRLEERYVPLHELGEAALGPGVDPEVLAECLAGAPGEVRCHLSNGALQSFVRTLPLLHPKGTLQVQDLFVTELADYRRGFRGPGKLDGSIVNWVNGALLRAAADRLGHRVEYAPFRYRPGSAITILTTSMKD